LGLLTWGRNFSERERPRDGKELGVVEGSSGMEGSSRRRMTSRRSDVTEAHFGKAGCGGSSGLDFERCGLPRESSW